MAVFLNYSSYHKNKNNNSGSLCRWLANNGQKEAAEEILLKIARWNRKEISIEQREEIRKILSNIEKDSHQITETKLNPITMFKGSNLKNTLIMLLNWVTVNVGAYTLGFSCLYRTNSTIKFKVENILKGSLDLIPSPSPFSENSNYGWESLLEE